MTAEKLLSTLDGVKRIGDRQWKACCPAHDDKRPSMMIRELDDGRVLLHCFAGCDVESILASVDLEFDALFPERVSFRHAAKGVARRFNAADVLSCVSIEAVIVYLCAKQASEGTALSEVDLARLLVAVSRVGSALDAAGLFRHG